VVFLWEEELLLNDLLDNLGDLLSGLNDLLADLLGNLLAVAAFLDLLASVLLAELVLENLGEKEVCADSSSGSADDDADDHEDLGVILLFLVETEHERNLL